MASDAGSLGDIRSLATLVRQKYDKLDGVVLNAGIAPFLPIEAWDETTFDNLFSVNVKGPFFLLQQLVPLLPEGASVVFNTSVVHEVGMATAAPYGATKGALRALVRSLSVELAPKKIRVNAVAPGPIATPIYDKMGMSKEQLDGFAAHMATRVPLGRFGEAKDIANAFVFLLSDDSAFVSGEELLVDGGLRNNAA